MKMVNIKAERSQCDNKNIIKLIFDYDIELINKVELSLTAKKQRITRVL